MTRLIHRARIGVAILPLLVAACGSYGGAPTANPSAASAPVAGASESSSEPIKIGVVGGLSGANSIIMPSVIQEAELAVDEINAAGGVLGRDVVLEIIDDQSGADGALKAFNSAVHEKKVDVIIAMETSAARNAGLPIAQRANTPFIYTSNYEGGACAPNLFIDAPVPIQVVKPLVDYFTKNLQPKTWYLIGSDYAYGRGQVAAFRDFIEASGGTVVGEDFNPIDAADWTAIFGKVRDAGPDAVATATAGGAPNVSFLKQWKESGLTQPIASMSIDEGTAVEIGAPAEGVFYPSNYFTAVDDPKNTAFLDALEGKYGSEMKTPNFLSVPEYYGVHLYALAVAKAGTTDPDAVLKALPEVSFEGPSGVVQMNKQHHAALDIWIGQVQGDGTTKVVESMGLIEPGEQCPNL